jgi:hypothetical protein
MGSMATSHEKLFSEGNDKRNMEASRARQMVQSCFPEIIEGGETLQSPA